MLHAARLMTWLVGVRPALDLSWKALDYGMIMHLMMHKSLYYHISWYSYTIIITKLAGLVTLWFDIKKHACSWIHTNAANAVGSILSGQGNIVVHVCTFSSFWRRAKNPKKQCMWYKQLSLIVNQENSCAYTTFCFFSFVQVIHSNSIICSWKSAETYAVSDLLKIILNKNSTWNESQNSKKFVYGTYTFLTNQENSCAHATVYFLNFVTYIIDFWIYNFHENVHNSLPFHISKISFTKMAHTTILHCLRPISDDHSIATRHSHKMTTVMTQW